MDPVVVAALIAAFAAITTGLLTFVATRTAERAKQRQEANIERVDAIRLQMEGWDHLVDALQSDIERRDVELARRQVIIDSYRKKFGFLGDEDGYISDDT